MALKFVEEIIHSKKDDFIKVKNIRLYGTNEEIGFKLGEIAKKQHTVSRHKNSDLLKNTCQKYYLNNNYPVHYRRMKGMANAYGEDIENTEYDFTCFGNPLGINACSAVFYPPEFTETKTGILSRNLDLPTISFSEMITEENVANEPAAMSNLYVIEIYPDCGFSSIVNLSFELYGLGLDGINSEGLAVTHLYADSVNTKSYKPSAEYGLGINEMLTVQFLLDNCRNVYEAKELLLCNKHFYLLLPTHFLIADKNGNSFVWEYSPEHNKEYIIDGNSDIQIITNFLLHQYPNPMTFPKSKDRSCAFERYKTLDKAIKKEKGKISVNKMKEINSKVFISDVMFADEPPFPERTIYHNLYDTSNNSMEISFYRKDDGKQQLRTEYYKFRLK
jgi:predicted choloylglycine hydrolase